MSAFITAIGTSNPPHSIPQQDVLEFMIKAHQLNDQEAHSLRVLYRASGITNRFTTIPDYANDSSTFYPNTTDLLPFPDMKMRSDWYADHAVSLSENAIRSCLPSNFDYQTISHFITVSCTGMYAPGLDIDLVERLGLRGNVERTSINFMGCYAAFNALKLAKHICSNHKARVLIVCTELCTLHFQKEKTDDNLLANALFGDGSAAILVENEPNGKVNLALSQFECALLPTAKKEMAWNIGNFGFEMKLSAYVPEALQSGIPPLLSSLKKETFNHYAIHPGGKKILEVVEKKLGISKEINRHAHHVLRQYGNMSSPTILFVLKEILDGLTPENHKESLLGLAFGPGLTLESLVATVHA